MSRDDGSHNADEEHRDVLRYDPRAFEYYEPLRRVKQHLEKNFDEPLSATVAATIAGLNPTYFSSYFHDKVGARFLDWQHLVRVERARMVIRQRDISIVELARLVGYRDLRTFERAFKKHANVTASAYRRRVRPSRNSRGAVSRFELTQE